MNKKKLKKQFIVLSVIMSMIIFGIGGLFVYAISSNTNIFYPEYETNSNSKDSKFTGTVYQLLGNFIFVLADENDDICEISNYVYVSLAFQENKTDILAGDTITVYYDGDIRTFAGMVQIDNVYDIAITGNSGKSEEELRLSPPVFEKPNFPVNENGQTYGSASGCNFEDLPDLIQAIGTNGKKGYVYQKDLEDEQTVEYMKRLEKLNKQGIFSKKISLYENDGITVIGEYEILINAEIFSNN